MVDTIIPGLTGSQQNVYTAIYATLKAYGLEGLANNVLSYIQQGYSADVIALEIQNTTEWKQRFKGNEIRKANGLAVLSPAEYLATEAAYQQLFRSYGLPEGFYDSTSDFADFIGNNVSPAEMQQRLDLRVDAVVNGSLSGVTAYMRENFGVPTGSTVAWFIDPQRALPLLQKQVRAAQIGASARSAADLDLGPNTALRLAERGVSMQEALAGFAEVAQRELLTRQLPGQRGATVNTDDLIAAEFEGDEAAARRIRQISAARESEFGGGEFASTREGFTGLRTSGQ